MKIIVPVTSAGKNLRSRKVKEPITKRSTPENMVMPSTSGTPPISAASMQADRAAESATERDWKPEPMKRPRTVCSMEEKPMQKRAAASRELESFRSRPAARAMETGIAMPRESTSSMCCREEKNSGAAGGTCPEE